MTNRTQRLAIWLRWLMALAWGLVAVVYLDWLFAPLLHGRPGDGGWWYPSRFVFYAWKSRTNLDWFRFGDDGLRGVLGCPLETSTHVGRIVYGLTAGAFLAALLLAAGMFLSLGRRGLRELPAKRRPTAPSLAASSFLAGLLGAAGVALLLDTLGVWGWVVLHSPRFMLELARLAPLARDGPSFWPGLVILLLACGFWVAVFSASWSYSTRYWQFERMTLALLVIGGIILAATEALRFTLPSPPDGIEVDGRYTAAVLASTVMIWAWGCRILLLFRLRGFERMRNSVACFACGYDLSGTLAAERHDCPECGAPIDAYQKKAAARLAAQHQA
jgi:hypothetical protein